MNWNKRVIPAGNYREVADKVGIYPDFSSCFEHIKKHVCNAREPWHLIFDVKNYDIDCQISREIAVKIYKEISPEIEKSVHFFFETGCYTYIEKGAKTRESRVFGIGPLGLVVIMSPQNVLTCYFLEKASKKEKTGLWRFANAVNKISKRALWEKKRAGEKIQDDDYMKFPSSETPFFLSKNRFASFLEQYQQIADTKHIGEDIKKLLKERKS